MNADDAHAVGDVALDGLGADVAVPLSEEIVDGGRILSRVLPQLVEEGADVGTLVGKAVETEVGKQLFDQFVESLLAVLCRPRLVELHDFAAGLDEEGTGQLVVGVGDEPQGVDDYGNGQRSIQAECLVADDADGGQVLGKVVGNDWDVAVDTHQNGNLALWHLAVAQFLDGIDQSAECLFLIVVGGQQLDSDKALVRLVGRYLLTHLGIGPLQLTSLWLLLQLVVLYLGCSLEEGIVELNDVALRSAVHLQHFGAQHVGRELLLNVVQQPPVAASPAVDTLLDVAHNQVFAVAMAHGLEQQHAEVLPLHGAGVLEFVYHDVLQLRANLLEDKRRVAVADEGVKQFLRVAQQEAVSLVVHRAYLIFYTAEQPHLVQVAQGECGRLVESPLAGTLFDGIAQDVA